MATGEPSSSAKPPPPPGSGFRRSFTVDENAQFRHRLSQSRNPGPRVRRSSTLSDYSKGFQSSTDDLLLPKPSATGHEESRHESSAWDSVPLAFALLPAIGGMLFTNGGSVITDVMLLGLAAVFLNWSVRLPWDWYHSAQAIRTREEYNEDAIIHEEIDNDNEEALSTSQTTLDEVPEEEDAPPAKKSNARLLAHKAATKELFRHEILALLSCFLFPVLGAYLLHTLRTQLTRPSEGLVSNYNLTIFLLASELRPMSHLVKLVQSRTLHLQRVVNSNPYDEASENESGDVKDMLRRVEALESRTSLAEPSLAKDPVLNSKQSAMLTTEVKKTLQPDLDALNRAVRRYEKRATLQTFQTESRLLDLEARLSDAISLAAAAANNGQKNRGFTGVIVEWVATAIVLPIQAFSSLAILPFKTIKGVVNYGKVKIFGHPQISEKSRRTTNGKQPSHGRVGDRLQGRVAKK
ncbi:hypothetical protein LHYA1_G008838 [Lachnellula hyalina]|uniref:Uncharacterized protein n=1 Tax=Lachnellula hyalina TaxID=1316788 RepID=A0A8H8TVY9_9HELO|nr:uncharacterized protein LHYA1_G008838 [Lachnellula hyalina]TVY22402.1 hypothetical protein LHYA1_G008838 [Lachnellula hyalina]